jgi:hypothetical protein
MTPPSYLERQFIERLQGAGWVKAFTLPSSPKVVENLLEKGWIEKDRIEGRLCTASPTSASLPRRCGSELLTPAPPNRQALTGVLSRT